MGHARRPIANQFGTARTAALSASLRAGALGTGLLIGVCLSACADKRAPEHGRSEASSGSFQAGTYGNYRTMEDARKERLAKKAAESNQAPSEAKKPASDDRGSP